VTVSRRKERAKTRKERDEKNANTNTNSQQVLDAGDIILLLQEPHLSQRSVLFATAVNYLKPIIGPRSELEQAKLFVEWEVSDVHFTRAE